MTKKEKEEPLEEAFKEDDSAPKLISFDDEQKEGSLPPEEADTQEEEPLKLEEPISKKKEWLSLLSPSMISLLFMVILVGMGEKMAERFLPLYLVALGGGALAVSSLNGMDNLLSALYSFPGGFLSDKIGYKRALIVFNIMAMFGYSLVIIINTWWAVLVGALFFISWTAISLPAVMSMIAHVIPKKKHTMGVTLHSLIRRLPMALGPIFGGLLIKYLGTELGIRVAFGIAIGLAAIATILQWFLAKEPEKKKETIRLLQSLKNIPGALWHLLVSDILIRFAEQIPYAFVVIYAVNMKGISEVQFGVLTTIEMVTAIIIYLPVAYFADKYRKKPFVLTTFIFFTAFPFFLILCDRFWLFVIAFIIRGLKEFGEPTRKSLILELAPEEAKANTFGTYYLLRDLVVSLAAFGAGFLWKIANVGYLVNFLVAGAFGVIGTIYFAVFGKDMKSLEQIKAKKLLE